MPIAAQISRSPATVMKALSLISSRSLSTPSITIYNEAINRVALGVPLTSGNVCSSIGTWNTPVEGQRSRNQGWDTRVWATSAQHQCEGVSGVSRHAEQRGLALAFANHACQLQGASMLSRAIGGGDGAHPGRPPAPSGASSLTAKGRCPRCEVPLSPTSHSPHRRMSSQRQNLSKLCV